MDLTALFNSPEEKGALVLFGTLLGYLAKPYIARLVKKAEDSVSEASCSKFRVECGLRNHEVQDRFEALIEKLFDKMDISNKNFDEKMHQMEIRLSAPVSEVRAHVMEVDRKVSELKGSLRAIEVLGRNIIQPKGAEDGSE